MNIKNASILTGVSDQMIRYYEKLGLINPKRNKNNNYRDYQQADINNIVMIKQKPSHITRLLLLIVIFNSIIVFRF